MQTLTRRGVGDAAAGLGLHFLHMSEGPFSHDTGHLVSNCLRYNVQAMNSRNIGLILRLNYNAPKFADLRECYFESNFDDLPVT